MSKYLVTGGAGFIGSHIVDALVAANHSVRVLDDFSTGSLENIGHLDGKIELMRGDISDKETVDSAVKGMDYIFHEAAQTSVVDSIKNPVKTWDINIKGTKLLLNAAVKFKVKKLVLASSANIYGNDPMLPKLEDMPPKPSSPYGESKLMDELMSRKYYETDKLKSVCLRYFNVYGPRQSPSSEYSGVISIFMKKIIDGEQPMIYGDGNQTRDFIYVADVVRANLLAMKSTKAAGEVINVATGKETSLKELVKSINVIAGTAIEALHGPERVGDIARSVADISKARKLLGFEPKYSLEQGLGSTVEWFKSQGEKV
ncbi:MAG: SDR family oxidoreductase [Candidatus Micrarchaeia archaeon]|jgi:UDP-glucose 4-epimerase